MTIDPEKMKRARCGDEQPFSFSEVMPYADAVLATLRDTAPEWLISELACDGVSIYKSGSGWVLGPLSD